MSNRRVPSSATKTVGIVVNGEPVSVTAPATVAGVLAHLGMDPERVAVEHNRAIVKRPEWESRPVAEGDRFEVVTFVGGG